MEKIRMKNNFLKIFIISILIGLLFSLGWINLFVFASDNYLSISDTVSNPTPYPTNAPMNTNEYNLSSINDLEERVNNLEGQIGIYSSLIDSQSNIFNASVSRSESNINLLLALMAISSIIFGLIGLGFIKKWVENSVENYINNISEKKLSKLMEYEQLRIRNKWDPKFAKIYDEYLNTVPRDSND